MAILQGKLERRHSDTSIMSNSLLDCSQTVYQTTHPITPTPSIAFVKTETPPIKDNNMLVLDKAMFLT